MSAENLNKLKLGWIGLGRMGEEMAKLLLKQGCDLSVWNRTRSKAEPLVEFGAKLVDGKVDLAGCDIVFTMVSTTNDLKEVLFSAGGLLSSKTKPKMVIDSSSISQEGSADVRAELEKRGIDYLCAPVSGNAKVVKAGKLLVVASGPKAAYETAKSYLAMFGRSEMWVGEGELARVWKIAHNTMFGVIIQNLCEITVLAEKAGMKRHAFLDFLNKSVMGSMFTTYKTPALSNLDFHVTFTPELLRKDIDLGLSAGRTYGVPMPLTSLTRDLVQTLIGHGYTDQDFSTLLLLQAKASGIELEPENVDIGDGLSAPAA